MKKKLPVAGGKRGDWRGKFQQEWQARSGRATGSARKFIEPFAA